MENVKSVKGIRLFERNVDASNNYAYFPILIETEYGRNRDELYDYMRENDIYPRKYFYPLTSDQVCFEKQYRSDRIGCARELAKEVLVIPFYENLEVTEMKKILNIIKL